MFHHLITLLCDGKLFTAPINPAGMRILDIGTCTGIWAIQMGDKYPTAEIFGNDLSPIQPGWVPPNVKFFVDDIEAPWASSQKYDFIHSRYMAASIKDWPALMESIYENVSPGGWVEFQDYDTACFSQDNTIPPGYKATELMDNLRKALAMVGRELDPGPFLKGWVEDAGFINITHKVLPLPIGMWPREKKLKEVGAFMTLQYTEGMEALTIPFTQILGWQKEEVEVFNAQVRNDVRNKNIHSMHQFHIVTAQKPLD